MPSLLPTNPLRVSVRQLESLMHRYEFTAFDLQVCLHRIQRVNIESVTKREETGVQQVSVSQRAETVRR
jgi:hypothetical protein